MSREKIEEIITLARPGDSIMDTIRKMAEQLTYNKGAAVIVDENRKVLGIFNDGDVLRLIGKDYDLSRPVESVMVKEPVAVGEGLSHRQIISEVQRQLRIRNPGGKRHVRNVLVVDRHGRLSNVINYVDLLTAYKKLCENVSVFGQGFIGLPLSAALAGAGHNVTGVDINSELIRRLNRGDVHIREPMLSDTVKASLDSGSLAFATSLKAETASVHIIAVGTPVSEKGEADLAAVESAAAEIAECLRRGDLVMLLSTVPIGTTRKLVKRVLEKNSRYKAGQDFNLAFTPERAVEGRVMAELRELPQIVGGLTPVCTQKAASFWSTVSNSVIQVESVEEAELIKLINNSFRDLSFAFSNSVAELSDRFNINSFKLIKAANEGYPRNTIPVPGPGVGGYCLTKDPLLFASVKPGSGHAKLAREGRKLNEKAAGYPMKIFERYLRKNGLEYSDMVVFLIGLAFKGWPETNDIRYSSSVSVAKRLIKGGARVLGWDAVVTNDRIMSLGVEPVEYKSGCSSADAVFIMNNHPHNVTNGFVSTIRGRKILIFDGWSMLSSDDIERIKGITYSTMGYFSDGS